MTTQPLSPVPAQPLASLGNPEAATHASVLTALQTATAALKYAANALDWIPLHPPAGPPLAETLREATAQFICLGASAMEWTYHAATHLQRNGASPDAVDSAHQAATNLDDISTHLNDVDTVLGNARDHLDELLDSLTPEGQAAAD